MSIEPYRVSIPDSKLEQLHQKLSLAHFPDELNGAEWAYGAPLADVKRLAGYWKDGFDWRKVEANINALPNYVTEIQAEGFESLKIHFLHQRSENDKAIPLLFIHGCLYASLL